jgi:hypothetical protein
MKYIRFLAFESPIYCQPSKESTSRNGSALTNWSLSAKSTPMTPHISLCYVKRLSSRLLNLVIVVVYLTNDLFIDRPNIRWCSRKRVVFFLLVLASHESSDTGLN